MSKESEIKKGGLAKKLADYTPEPPEVVWENVSAQVQSGNSRRRFLILFSAAAGLALAITVGINFLTNEPSSDLISSTETQATEPVSRLEEADSGLENHSEEIGTAIVENDVKLVDVPELRTTRKDKARLEKKVIHAMQEIVQEEMKPNDLVLAMADTEPFVMDSSRVEDLISSVSEESAAAAIKVNEDSLLKLLQHEDEIDSKSEVVIENAGSKWQIGAAVSPQISYRDVASSNMMQNSAANNSESARITYAGGVQVQYKQSKRLTVEAGIYYNKMGVNIGEYSNFKNWRNNLDNEALFSASDNVVSLSNSMGTIVSKTNSSFVNNYSMADAEYDGQLFNPEELKLENSTVNSFTQSFEYLEIPFNLKYKIFDKVFKVQLIGGLSTNFLVNSNISAVTDAEKVDIGEVQDIRMVNYSGNVGFGFVYEILNNLSLSVEPRFRYYLNSINASYLPATHPYTFGLHTGVNYTF